MDHIVKLDSRANNSLWTNSTSGFISKNPDFAPRYDVAIIGGGFSGLWSAFHLARINSSLKIALFEAEEIGFGASGRNGGWVSSDYPVYRSTLVKRHGREKTELLFTSLRHSIEGIGQFAAAHAPQAGFVKSGTLTFARNQGQRRRLEAAVDSDHRYLEASEIETRIHIDGVLGGLFNEEFATVQPFELQLALVNFLQSVGIEIFNQSRASRIEGGLLVNSRFVAAETVIEATEVFGDPKRDFIPLYSLMVATEPLSDRFWREIGNDERFTFAEGAHLINYAQRTIDGRLAIGGRGVTYPYKSRLRESKEMTASVHQRLIALAKEWFPTLRDVEFTHRWGGAVAITRDWEPYLLWDQHSRFGKIGGYAGDGVTMSYLAAKALAYEITDQQSALRELHFVNRRIRRWEPEPLRYVAINSLVKLNSVADKEEKISGRPSLLNRIIAPVILR